MEPCDPACIARYAGPYERWVFSDDLGKPFAFPAIRRGGAHCFAALLEGTDTLPTVPGVDIRVPPIWQGARSGAPVLPFVFRRPGSTDDPGAELSAALAELHSACAGGGVAPRFRVNVPIADAGWTSTYDLDADDDGWVPPATRPRAIIAVIDDGIPFAHRAFLGSDGRTRISHCWLQSAPARSRGAVPFGKVLTNDQIDRARHQFRADEAALYRATGAVTPGADELGTYMRRQATHGAHVAGIAAGNGAQFASHPLGDDVQVIAVQLPNTIAWDTSGFGKEMYMLAALHYVLDRASRIAAAFPEEPGELPLVVNFSYGWTGGRHDGASEMELAIEHLLTERRRVQPATHVVMPMGNTYAGRMHGQIAAADLTDGRFAFGWQMVPGDRTSSYLELWLPQGMALTGAELTLTPPPASGLAPVTLPISADPAEEGGDPRRFADLSGPDGVLVQLSADLHRGTRWRVLLAAVPTSDVGITRRRAPVGTWRVELHLPQGLPNGPVNVWIQRDDDPAMLHSGGRQSHLVDLGDAPEPSPLLQDYGGAVGFIRGHGALSGVASAPGTLRVTGHVVSCARPSSYSGASGVTMASDGRLMPWGAAPDVSAPADDGQMRPGLRSIGVYSGTTARLSGTSGAAPVVARQLVANLAAGRDPMERFGPALPLRPQEPQTVNARTRHATRTGAWTAEPITRVAPVVDPGTMALS